MLRLPAIRMGPLPSRAMEPTILRGVEDRTDHLRESPLLNRFTIVLVLFAIALASTIIALALQSYFGRLPFLALLGQILATVGAAAFAIKLSRGH